MNEAHHGVAAIVGQDHNVDGRGVIGDTDSSFPGFVFSVGRHDALAFVSQGWCHVQHAWAWTDLLW